MIKQSFLFLGKIGKKKEQSLWQQGINTWHDFLNHETIKGISFIKKQYYNRQLRKAQHALLNNDSSYFLHKLASKDSWRLYPEFKDETCFLDIEIDQYGNITLVGISNYYSTNFFVKNSNLSKECLEQELQKYKLLITFNGSSFDLPKLQKQFQITISIPHIDLKPLCLACNLNGGLKEVEKILNLKRPSHLYGSPLDLWKAFHASGDREYLDLLLEYNREDVENLKRIMDYCYGKLFAKIKQVSP